MEMDILYVSCYPNEYFKRVVNESKMLNSQPAQKFNKMFVDGLKQNDVNISVLSTFNHLKYETEKLWIKEEVIMEDDIQYYFLPYLKRKYLNRIYMNYIIKSFISDWKKKHPDGIIVMDFLKPFSYTISKYAKGNSIVTIITDLPEFLFNNSGAINRIKVKLKLFYYNKTIKNATHYIFLSDQMNTRLNKNKKPYCIIEGLVDYRMETRKENVINSEQKICLYSGALHKKYGIENLVQAFTSNQLSNFELHLYGNGDCVRDIEQIVKKYHNIKYFGNVLNDVVVQKQMQATVLINPRPTDEEFTQFSFPSKNIEYMVSGTPVITTNLPGIPNEYKQFVYITKGYGVEDIINCVNEVLNKPADEIRQKGLLARGFVLSTKNNIVQSKKILDLVSVKKD